MPEMEASQELTPASMRARTGKVIDFVTQNFALTSAVVVLVGYLLGTIVLYSYLSFFDWRLIWVVEQADILKFGVIAIALFSPFSWLLWAVAEDAATFYKESGRRVILLFVILLAITSLGAAASIYAEYRTYAEPQYAFIVLMRLAPLTLLLTVLTLTRSFSGIWPYSVGDAVADVSLVITTATVLGLTLAVWVRDTEGFEQDVTVDGHVWSRAGVIMVTPHHTVLYAKGIIAVVPSSNVSRMQSRRTEPRARRSV